MIQITFPASLKINNISLFNRSQSIVIKKGLNSTSPRNLININYDVNTNIMLISNFTLKSDLDPIKIQLLVGTPDVAGLSSPIVIATYTSELSGSLIDIDSTFAQITVNDTPSPKYFTYSSTSLYVSTSTSIIGTLRFVYTPLVTVPKNGYVQIIFSSEIQTSQIDTSVCYVQNSAILTNMTNALACNKINNKIIIKTTIAFYAGITYSFELRNTVILPKVAGNYFADITTFSTDGTSAIESYAQTIYFSPQPFIDASLALKPNEMSQKSTIELIFTTPVDIITGVYPESVSESSSFVRFTIGPDGVFPVDLSLGMGVSSGSSIPCIGILGFASSTIQMECTLYYDSKSFIVVKGYPSISAYQQAGILIPNFTNFVGPVNISVSVVVDHNGVYTELTNYSKSVDVSSTLTGANTFNFSSLPNYYNISNYNLSKLFTLSFDLKVNQKVNALQSIIVKLPFYSDGFCRIANNIECLIQDISYTCYCIPGIDWLLIKLSQFNEIPPSDVNIIISGLQWPGVVNSLMSNIQAQILGSDNSLLQQYTYPILDSASPSKFTYASLILNLLQNDPSSLHSFTFVCTENVPLKGIIVIEFPILYDLINVEPPVTITLPDYPDSDFTYYTSKNKIRISNMPYIAALTSFRININGIMTPAYGLKITNFNVYLYSPTSFLIAESLNFYDFSLEDIFIPSTIIVESIHAYPLNANAYATYQFMLEIGYNLLKGTEIQILFPDNYKAIPVLPECYIKGAISSFSECYTSFSTVLLILDEDYNYLSVDNPVIQITIHNILNYEPGLTNDFIFQTVYNSVITGQSSSSTITKINITSEAGDVIVTGFSFNPQNEGELSLLQL